MKKIMILYFSGAGSTKKVAGLMFESLRGQCQVNQCSFDHAPPVDLNDFDALIIGTPVYHGAPSYIVTKYLNSIRPLKKRTPVFIYNTRAISSCNTNRILI